MATQTAEIDARARIKPVPTVLPAFVDGLLEVISEAAPECEPREKEHFRSELSSYRRRIAAASENKDLAGVTSACLSTCEQYLLRSKQYHADREGELAELISILREATSILVTQGSAFNAQMLSTTEAIGGLAELEDIRELRRRLSEEVTSLRKTIVDKQQQDDQMQQQLTQRVETLQARLAQAEQEAALDPLTRIANRGGFDRALRSMIRTSRSAGTPLTLALIDIDDFKSINDRRGHPIGDRVLLGTAQWLRRQTRATDFVARYGGDEFAVIFPGMKLSQTKSRLEHILQELSARHYEYEVDQQKQTVSWGTSCGVALLETEDTEDEFLARADQALYEAKRKGKSRVVTRSRSLLGGLLAR